MVGWLVGRFGLVWFGVVWFGWLVGWLVHWLVSLSVSRLVCWSVGHHEFSCMQLFWTLARRHKLGTVLNTSYHIYLDK